MDSNLVLWGFNQCSHQKHTLCKITDIQYGLAYPKGQSYVQQGSIAYNRKHHYRIKLMKKITNDPKCSKYNNTTRSHHARLENFGPCKRIAHQHTPLSIHTRRSSNRLACNAARKMYQGPTLFVREDEEPMVFLTSPSATHVVLCMCVVTDSMAIKYL